MTDFNAFFHFAITVDNVIFGFDGKNLKVLLIKRGEVPFLDNWALPGHFVADDENLEQAATRILENLTGLREVYLEQVHSFGAVARHPMGRVVTVAYYSLINLNDYDVRPAFIAQQATWFNVTEALAMDLPFDHTLIINACRSRLRLRAQWEPIGFELLPTKFTLTHLKLLYDSILGEQLDKRNFRKKMLSMKILIDLNEVQEGVAHRPAKLYQFDTERYNQLKQSGFHLDMLRASKTRVG